MIEDRLDDYFIKYPLIYKQVVSELGDTENRMRIAIHMGAKNYKRAKRLLFNVLDTHIERWWN